MRQKSGPPNRRYADRFDRTAAGLEWALTLLGCVLYDDGTGMAYCVVKDGKRIGGPSSCQEDAMRAAVYQLLVDASQ